MTQENPETIWRYAPNPAARSSFKAFMEYGRRFPERENEGRVKTKQRQKTCPHEHGFELILRVKDGSDLNEPEYEYVRRCLDCWAAKDGENWA